MSRKTRGYTSIQLTPESKDRLKRKKRPAESYEQYLRRMGLL